MKLVKITKDGIDGYGEVPESAVPRVTAQGWRVVEDEVGDQAAALKGKELEDAVKAANEQGAGIPASATADEKRALLAEFRAQ